MRASVGWIAVGLFLFLLPACDDVSEDMTRWYDTDHEQENVQLADGDKDAESLKEAEMEREPEPEPESEAEEQGFAADGEPENGLEAETPSEQDEEKSPCLKDEFLSWRCDPDFDRYIDSCDSGQGLFTWQESQTGLHCPTGSTCRDKHCVTEAFACAVNKDCQERYGLEGAYYYCYKNPSDAEQGECRVALWPSDPCPEGYENFVNGCAFGLTDINCRPVKSCAGGADCPDGEFCDVGGGGSLGRCRQACARFVQPGIPAPTWPPVQNPSYDMPYLCPQDAICHPDNICWPRTAGQIRCESRSDCPEYMLCGRKQPNQISHCMPPCTVQDDCRAPWVCDDRPGSASYGNCVLSAPACPHPCAAHADCATGERCDTLTNDDEAFQCCVPNCGPQSPCSDDGACRLDEVEVCPPGKDCSRLASPYLKTIASCVDIFRVIDLTFEWCNGIPPWESGTTPSPSFYNPSYTICPDPCWDCASRGACCKMDGGAPHCVSCEVNPAWCDPAKTECLSGFRCVAGDNGMPGRCVAEAPTD